MKKHLLINKILWVAALAVVTFLKLVNQCLRMKMKKPSIAFVAVAGAEL